MRPSDQGFGTSLIHRGGGLGQPSDPIENKGHYTNPILFRNNQEVQSKGYCTDVFFNAAKEFITKSKSSQQPFFASITVNVPHSPFSDVPSDLLAKYQKKDLSEWGEEPQKLARIAAMLENLDANVGLLTGLLEKENLLNNTIIIFMNDNGVNTTRFNKGLRGKKGQVYEGGVRSPLWIHWPDKVKKGRDMIDHSTAHIDIMPTVLDLCGLGVPDAFGFDGVSLAESILKLEPEGAIKALDRPIIMQWHKGATPIERRHFMVRKGDWKLLNPSKSSSKKENLELYNLAKDPFEENNLVASNEKIVDALLADYDRWFRDVTETRARDLGIPYILVNKEKENPLVLTWQERISKDWAYNDPGFWKLQFEHEGRCDIRVEFPTTFDRDLSGWTAQLSIGRETYKKTLFNRSSHYTFLALNFQKGKHLLKCSFTSPDGKETISAYQMRLLHR